MLKERFGLRELIFGLYPSHIYGIRTTQHGANHNGTDLHSDYGSWYHALGAYEQILHWLVELFSFMIALYYISFVERNLL